MNKLLFPAFVASLLCLNCSQSGGYVNSIDRETHPTANQQAQVSEQERLSCLREQLAEKDRRIQEMTLEMEQLRAGLQAAKEAMESEGITFRRSYPAGSGEVKGEK